MNLDKLTILGCSSSIVLLLATTNPAEAKVINPIKNLSVVSASTQMNQLAENPVNVDIDSDTVGDLAVEKFGCDCMGHRVQVMKMLQGGSLELLN